MAIKDIRSLYVIDEGRLVGFRDVWINGIKRTIHRITQTIDSCGAGTYEVVFYDDYVGSNTVRGSEEGVCSALNIHPNLKIDQKVLVWDQDKKFAKKRHFHRFEDDGTIRTFSHGKTSFTNEPGDVSVYWRNYEIIEDVQEEKIA